MVLSEPLQVRCIQLRQRPAKTAVPADIPPLFLGPQKVADLHFSHGDAGHAGIVEESDDRLWLDQSLPAEGALLVGKDRAELADAILEKLPAGVERRPPRD